MDEKVYKIRLYITEGVVGNIINMLVRLGVLRLQNSFDGMNDILAIYDVSCDSGALCELIRIGVSYFPLNRYEDFVIACPECEERIDDDMILTTYDENLLSGYNILCHRCGAGTQMANVEFINQ